MKPYSVQLGSIERKLQVVAKKMVDLRKENAFLSEEIKRLKAQNHSEVAVSKPVLNIAEPKKGEVEKNIEMSVALMQKLKKDFIQYISEIDECIKVPNNRS